MGKLGGVDNVAKALGYLLPLDCPEAVGEKKFGKGKAGCHQHGGPEGGVEALEDVLGHKLDVWRPDKSEAILIIWVPADSKIIGEGIEPDVDYILLVARDGNAPVNLTSRDTGVPDTLVDEAENFVSSGFGFDRVFVGVEELLQGGGMSGGAEEVGGLSQPGDWSPALRIGTVAALHLGGGQIGLIVDAIPALVFTLVYVAGLQQEIEQVLSGAAMAVFGGADEDIVRDAQVAPEGLEIFHEQVNVLPGGAVILFGGGSDLYAMLVGSGSEEDRETVHPLETGKDIGGDSSVGVTDVWPGVHVVDGSGDEEGFHAVTLGWALAWARG